MNAYFDFSRGVAFDASGKQFPLDIILIDSMKLFNAVVPSGTADSAYAAWSENPSGVRLERFFYEAIVTFGEGWRIWGKYFRQTRDWDSIGAIISDVSKMPCQSPEDAENIILKIRSINGLGLSYASKIGRFVNKNLVVLDSIISRETGLDYKDLFSLCQATGIRLGVNPRDVESAIFCWVQRNRNGKKKARWISSQNVQDFS